VIEESATRGINEWNDTGASASDRKTTTAQCAESFNVRKGDHVKHPE